MKEIQETKSKWKCIYQQERDDFPICVDADRFLNQPQQLLNEMSYYKFAAKMIGKNKHVLHLECGDGMGSWVLAKECGSCVGVTQEMGLQTAKQNYSYPSISFTETLPEESFDAIVSLEPIDIECFELLEPNGIAVVIYHSELGNYFDHVFPFSANDQVIRIGHYPKSDIILALCCNPIEKE